MTFQRIGIIDGLVGSSFVVAITFLTEIAVIAVADPHPEGHLQPFRLCRWVRHSHGPLRCHAVYNTQLLLAGLASLCQNVRTGRPDCSDR